jgi:hypothetical protein
MEALDGNAIAGPLMEYFGSEMTPASGACRHCATVSQIAELAVYMPGLGAVARCPTCGKVVMVLVTIREELRVDLSGFALTDPAGL